MLKMWKMNFLWGMRGQRKKPQQCPMLPKSWGPSLECELQDIFGCEKCAKSSFCEVKNVKMNFLWGMMRGRKKKPQQCPTVSKRWGPSWAPGHLWSPVCPWISWDNGILLSSKFLELFWCQDGGAQGAGGSSCSLVRNLGLSPPCHPLARGDELCLATQSHLGVVKGEFNPLGFAFLRDCPSHQQRSNIQTLIPAWIHSQVLAAAILCCDSTPNSSFPNEFP